MKRLQLIMMMTAIMLFVSVPSYAQDAEIGVIGGGLLYQGDLVPGHFYISQTRPFGGILYRYYYNPRLNAYVQLMKGEIRGADSLIDVMDVNSKERAERNLDFSSPIIMANVGIEFNILPYISNTRRFPFAPFISTRLGVIHYEPTRTIDGVTFKLRTLNPEGKQWRPFALTLSYGAGVKYSVGGRWNIGLSITQHFTSTDYLDGVSRSYRPDVKEMYEKGGEEALKARAIVGYIDYYARNGYSKEQIMNFLQHVGQVKRGDPSPDWMTDFGVVISRTIRPCRCEILKNLF